MQHKCVFTVTDFARYKRKSLSNSSLASKAKLYISSTIKSYRGPLKCFWADGHLPVSVGKFGHVSCSGKVANAFG